MFVMLITHPIHNVLRNIFVQNACPPEALLERLHHHGMVRIFCMCLVKGCTPVVERERKKRIVSLLWPLTPSKPGEASDADLTWNRINKQTAKCIQSKIQMGIASHITSPSSKIQSPKYEPNEHASSVKCTYCLLFENFHHQTSSWN